MESVRRFVGLRLSGPLPDRRATSLGEGLFEEINAQGQAMTVDVVDGASTAPSSTKNRTGERDPQMPTGRRGGCGW